MTKRKTSRIYKSTVAKKWQEDALGQMVQAGWQSQPEGLYRMSLYYELHTIAMDVDGPEKIILDTVQTALNINDRWIGEFHGNKCFASKRKDQYLEIFIRIEPIETKAEFNEKFQQCRQRMLQMIYDKKGIKNG